MTIEQAKELIYDICSNGNDCYFPCEHCPTFKELLKCDYPEEF